ncbi:hypothetical protein Tco_0099415 [Tanacetum coccineum]
MNTPRAHRSPTVSTDPSETKKRKQTAGESSSPRKSLKITIKQRKIVEKDDDDSEDMIEPRSHKDNLKFVDDDDDKAKEKHSEDIGSLEIWVRFAGCAEFQDVDKRVPTIFDRARMEATLRDSLSNQSRNAKEFALPLEQSTKLHGKSDSLGKAVNSIPRTIPKTLIFYGPQKNLNEPPRYLYNKDLFFLKYGNTEEMKYILSLNKIHTEEFPEPDLEEKLNQWVRKVFKIFNEDAQLSIQQWKDSWHKKVYKQNQTKVRKNPKNYYSNNRITEVVRIVTYQPHGLDFMEQILVMRANDKPDSFSEADFKYLNKNDIEDLYYLCQSKEIDNQKIKLMNSLITFIRSCVIWERVYDFHLGIESYQMKPTPRNGLVGRLTKFEWNVSRQGLGRDKVGWGRRATTCFFGPSHLSQARMERHHLPYVFRCEVVIPSESRDAFPRTMRDVFRRKEASRVEDRGKLGLGWEGPYKVMEAYQNGSYKSQTIKGREVPQI